MKTGVQEIRVKSWDQLVKELFKDSFWKDLDRHRTKYLFRGLSRSTYRLTTTIQRLHPKLLRTDPAAMKQIESLLLRQFRKYAHRDVVERDSIWHWLSIANHHGLGTRLLDWTNSPFVALHFMTVNLSEFKHDGAVWAADFFKIHGKLPKKLRIRLKVLGVKVLTIDELEKEGVRTVGELEALSEDDCMVFFEPPSIDERIVNQYALLSVMPRVDSVPGEWFETLPRGFCRKIVVPAKLKSEIRERLDMMNITERVLFPGLDGLCDWLYRYYGPSTRKGVAKNASKR